MEKLRERLVGQRRKNCGGRVRERERDNRSDEEGWR